MVLAALCVLLIATAGAASTITFDFADGTKQGWSKGDPFGSGFNGTLNVAPTGGNPDQYLYAEDTTVRGGSLLVAAPIQLSGDLTLFGGLAWDELLPSDAIFSTSVLLLGPNDTFFRSDSTVQTLGSWSGRQVDFTSENGWSLIQGRGSDT